MEATFGVARSSNNVRAAASIKSSVLDVLNPQEDFQILGESQGMLLVQPVHRQPPIKGYILPSAAVRPIAPPQVFPRVDLGNSVSIPSVPASLPLSTFEAWLDSGAESPWLPAGYLDGIQKGQHPSVGAQIRQAISDHRSEWDAWVAEIRSQDRESTCTLDEWFVILAGGRELWSYRTERIFTDPSEHAAAPAWVSRDEVLHWTGHVRFSPAERKYKLWYEVQFTKLDRQFSGWYKAALLHPFIIPTPSTDVAVPTNSTRVFDLSRPLLRLPADPEFDAARKAGRAGAQYIDIRRALGYGVLQHNLCGELSVAALIGSDIIPFLQQWIAASTVARNLLARDWGTTTVNIQEMLRVVGKKYEFWRSEPTVAPLTPDYLRAGIDAGRMTIVKTGVTPGGIIRWNGPIWHWVLIEDVLPVGNTAWVRLYNPFQNRDEVYTLDAVLKPTVASNFGWWVEPTRPGLPAQPTVPSASQPLPILDSVEQPVS